MPFSKAAEIKDGYGPAINKLGNFFFSGFGVEKIDIPLAIRYYERAADLNDPDALINLGFLLFNFLSYFNLGFFYLFIKHYFI